MASTFPLEKMSVEEKLRAMELLWDDLCNRAGGVTSPAWHESVLAERDAALKRGDDRFEDWEAAKRDIRSKVSELRLDDRDSADAIAWARQPDRPK